MKRNFAELETIENPVLKMQKQEIKPLEKINLFALKIEEHSKTELLLPTNIQAAIDGLNKIKTHDVSIKIKEEEEDLTDEDDDQPDQKIRKCSCGKEMDDFCNGCDFPKCEKCLIKCVSCSVVYCNSCRSEEDGNCLVCCKDTE